MTCKEFQHELTLAEGEGGVSRSAREHLERCVACQQLVQENERLRAALRSLAESERAPESLREPVYAMVENRDVQNNKSGRPWVGVAAAAVLLSLAGYALKQYYAARHLTPNRLARDFILDHEHYLPGREEIVSQSAGDLETWFQGRVDFPVRIPQLPIARIEDARVCDIGGRKAALVHYRRQADNSLISLFVAPEPKAFEGQQQPVVVSTTYQGLSSRLWCHRGLVYSLVAALDDPSLQQIAESVRQQEP